MPYKNIYRVHGGIPAFGILIAHSWQEIGAVLYTIYIRQIKFVVELGTERGGLGAFLNTHSLYDPDFRYLTVEIRPEVIEPAFLSAVNKMDNESLIADEFDLETMNYIKSSVESVPRALIYCDGGNKPFEFLCYQHVLKAGDFLMVHDYKKEFKDRDYAGTTLLRCDEAYLKGCRQVLFMKPDLDSTATRQNGLTG